VHRLARQIQTEILGSAAAAERGQDGARLKGEVQSWNTTAASRLSLCRASWLFRIAGVGPNESSMGGRDALLLAVPATFLASVVPRSQIWIADALKEKS
jgi:hypothetical protein